MDNTILAQKRLIIFDCDGVLIDSYYANIHFFNRCLEQGGYPPLSGDDREKVVYMSTRQLIYELIPDRDEADRLFRISQETDYTPFITDVRPLFDFDRVLGALSEKYFLAIATNRGRSIDRLVNHFDLDRWFLFKISTIDAEPKPHPEMLLKCMDHFGVSKQETLYLGDSVSDRDAALNAGVDYLWVGKDEDPHINSVNDLVM
jgi:phosphoglycolate phosphatase